MSINYSFLETLNMLKNTFKYGIMISLIISSIIFITLLILNKDNKKIKYVIYFINIILICLICYYYLKGIITFNFNNPINNIYFYFFNSIIYLIIMSLVNSKIKYKKINYILYGLILIGLLFALFMTHSLNNVTLIVLLNIYPIIKFGNIIYIIYYLFVIFNLFKNKREI